MTTSATETIQTPETTPEATATPEATSGNNKPVHSVNYRGVHIAVFRNISNGRDDKRRQWYNVLVETRYRDGNGDFQSARYFDEDQLAVLGDLATEARRAIREAKQRDKAGNTHPRNPADDSGDAATDAEIPF